MSIESIIREEIGKYSYHLGDECIESLAVRLEVLMDSVVETASSRDYRL